jgi:protoheme IX farnesyltransferase
MVEQVIPPGLAARIHDHISMSKPMIGLLAAATGAAGYLSHHPADPAALVIAAGLFLLAGGAGILNNCQDRILDGRLRRTAGRPLVRQRIPLWRALAMSVAYSLLGLAVLWLGSGSVVVPALGLCGLLIYNGLYTPLKRKTPYAFVPGTVAGILCAYLGWVAAGGAAPSRAFFLFLAIVVTWQFPHFFLIHLIHRDDWLRSNLPTVLGRFAVPMLEKWVVLWLLSYAGLTLLLYLLGTVRAHIGVIVLLANGLGLVVSAVVFLFRHNRNGMYRLLRNQLGLSQLVVIMLVISRDWNEPF